MPVSVPLSYFGIDYDKLSKEQFVSLIEILKLSKYLKSPSTSVERQDHRCYHTERAKRSANKKIGTCF